MKTHLYLFGTVLALCSLLTHCAKDEPNTHEHLLDTPTAQTALDTLPGPQNPYSVANMKKALQSLQRKKGKAYA